MNKIDSTLLFLLAYFSLFALNACRETPLSPHRLKFAKNHFVFKVLEKPASPLVGKLQLNSESLLSLSDLAVTMHATRDSYSEKLFAIDAKTLEIRATQSLDASLTSAHYFRVSIRAKTETLASCTLAIRVVSGNLNTPPRFSMSAYEAQVFENNAPDTLLIRVEATDDDLGENARLTYQLRTNQVGNVEQND